MARLAPGTEGSCPVCGWTDDVHNHVAHFQAAIAPLIEDVVSDRSCELEPGDEREETA